MTASEATPKTTSALPAFFSEFFLVQADPPDPAYKRRHAAEVIDGFRVLSLIVCAAMGAMFLVHILQWGMPPDYRSHHAVSLLACAVLAVAGAIGFWVSKSVRAPAVALAAAALLLGAAVVALTTDRLFQSARDGAPAPSLIPIVFLLLMVGTTLIPLRPARVVGLGIMLLLTCAASAAFMHTPLRGDLVDFAAASMSVAISAAISARSTSQRIGIYYAHMASMESATQTQEALSRALLAESAVTMERLAASLSHELNTPIGALKSATETLTRGVRRYATFPTGSRMPELVEDLAGAIQQSTARLSETVARIQRFANLDRSAIRFTDINQLVQDAVALMNPPSFNQAQVALNLDPLPQIWCEPHRLSVALASVLNAIIESGRAITIDTHSLEADVIVAVTIAGAEQLHGHREELELGFTVEAGRVQATGWDLFAARQLVREIGGDLKTDHTCIGEQTITITIPSGPMLPPPRLGNF